jgi:hypothetical protein
MQEPDEVTVYSFEHYDPATRAFVHAAAKAPRSLVLQLGGRILEGTAQHVKRHELDRRGLYRRIATGWGAVNDAEVAVKSLG